MFSSFRSTTARAPQAGTARRCIRYADRLVRNSNGRRENHVRTSKHGATDGCRSFFCCGYQAPNGRAPGSESCEDLRHMKEQEEKQKAAVEELHKSFDRSADQLMQVMM